MGVSYQIDKSTGLVLTRAFGRIEDEDLLLHVHKLKKDPNFSIYYSQIIDLSDVKVNGLTKNIVKELVHMSPFSGRSLRAIIAPGDYEFSFINDPAGQDFSRSIRAFRNTDDAINWINNAKVKHPTS